MKLFVFGFLLTLTTISAQAVTTYVCTEVADNMDVFQVDYFSPSKIIINEKDVASVDAKDLADLTKKSVRLNGSLRTLGDGDEGYSVTLKASRFLLSGSRVAYINFGARGPDGYYSKSYKCLKH